MYRCEILPARLSDAIIVLVIAILDGFARAYYYWEYDNV